MYFSFSKILAQQSYYDNSSGNKVHVCMYVFIYVCILPDGCHGNKRPPKAFPSSPEERAWEFVRVPVGVLSEKKGKEKGTERV